MKTCIFLFAAILLMANCGGGNVSKSKQAPGVTTLKGYFVKNTVEDTGNLQCFVFTDQQSMSQVCGMATTMSEKPDIPDFNNSIVIAIVGESTNRQTKINIVETKVENETLMVSVSEDISDEELTYTLRPLTLAAIDKSGIKKVTFRKGNVEISSANL